MNAARPSPDETHASRKAVVDDALLRLKTDLLGAHPSASGISGRQIVRLVATLAELGPVFSQFGRYLSTRHDFFRPEACLLFANTGTVRLPSGDELARERARHFPEDTADWLLNLRPEGARSDHLIHYYRWPGQGRLSLRLLSCEFLKVWEQDRRLLDKLVGPARRIWPGLPLKEVIDSFRTQVDSRCDLEGTAQAYRRFESNGPDDSLLGPERFVLPQVADEYCTPGIFTVLEPAPGPRSANAHAAFEDLFQTGRTSAVRVETARSLCLIWLRQAVRGSWFPEAPSAANLGFNKDGALCLLGGPLVAADAESQDFLFRYLCAVGANQPDSAADILLSHLRPGRRAKGLEEVRDLFRQIVPYRDGQINESGDHELFAEHILAQLRIIREAGYEIDPGLVAFQQSLACVARLAHQLSPRRDAFKDALYEFRWSDSLANLRSLFTLGTVAKQSQEWLNLVMEIPEKMNLAAQGLGLAKSVPVPVPSKKSSSPASSPWLLVLTHAFLILVLGWLIQTHFAHGQGSGVLGTVLVLSVVGAGISMIRCLSQR